MLKPFIARTGCALLSILIFLAAAPVFSVSAFADGQAETHYVLTASDFQEGSHAGSAAIVSSISSAVKTAGYTDIEGFLFAGDYDRNTIGNSSETAAGLQALDTLIDGEFPSLTKKIYVQGNHDPASVAGLTPSGANDAENYGVFVINNDDYMWYNSNETRIKQTASNLRAYLEEKEEVNYRKPIFVISHLPLHYSMRTKNDGDAQYAGYLFDELNDAGKMGLNIVFLYGHDHSHGWDNYLGGSAICLLPGDSINIAHSSRTEFTAETLAFTYMNAGYTGYYSSENGADNALTMCLFAFTDGEMTISRFDSEGLHNLKSAGTYNIEYDDRSYYSSDTRVYQSPQTLPLSSGVLQKNTFEDDAFGVSARFTGQGIEVICNGDAQANELYGGEGYLSYVCYTVEPVGVNVGLAEISLPLDGADPAHVRLYVKKNGVFERVSGEISGDRMRFTAPLPVTAVLATPDDPYASSAFEGLLWRVEAYGSSYKFYNLEKELYLGCESNATLNAAGALITVSTVTGGCKLALTNATGGKSAGDALHFGTANRCSFGEYSPFVFYEYVENDLYRACETPEDGKVCLIAYKSGSNAYLLSGVTTGDRIETQLRSIPLYEGAQSGKYASLLYKAEASGASFTFLHVESALYISCGGNAALLDTPAKFSVQKTSTGAYTLALAESIGGKSAGDALHFGSYDRVSFGTASAFLLYEYAGGDLVREAESVEDGKTYLIVYLSGGRNLALTGSVYGSGTSTRIETEQVELAMADEEISGFEDSAFFTMIYKAQSSGTGYTLKSVSTGQYLSCEGNATLSAGAASFTLSGSASALTLALAESIGGKSAGEALHLGSGNRVSYGAASPVSLYRFVEDDKFEEVETLENGEYYLIVFPADGQTFAMTSTVYNPGASSRMETAPVTVPVYVYRDPCDLNEDGNVSIEDVSVLLDYLSGKFTVSDPTFGDINGSGRCTVVDVSALLDRLAAGQ